MDECVATEQLQRWLNGIADEAAAAEITQHIKNCPDCQQRLSDLTDDDSLAPPRDDSAPDSSASLANRRSFTDEPQFKSLQKQLGEKVKRLARGQLLNSQNENTERELDSGNCSNGQLGSAEYDTVASTAF